MAKIDLSQYGITGTTEIVYNPSYEMCIRDSADAEALGVENGQIVNVKIDTDGRSLVFGDVVVRVSDTYALAMHIDTDESNAAGCGREVYGEIVK